MRATYPERFRHPIDAPDPLAQALYTRLFGGKPSTPSRAQAERLGRALWEGDPLADAWFLAAKQRADGKALMERALREGIANVPDAPPELVALFSQLESVPLWVDPEALTLGCKVYRRTAMLGQIVLGSFSLMGGYRSAAVAKPLMWTGKLRYSASRRLVDTGMFTMAVSEPDALRIGAEGYRAAVHVRMVHTAIRQGLLQAGDWDAQRWGVPLNQADLLGTNLLFSIGFLAGCQQLGLRFDDEETRALLHLWRYVGYLIGVDEDLLPIDVGDAKRAMYLVGVSQPPADEDSRALAQALHEVPLQLARNERERARAKRFMHVRAGLNRRLLGDAIADDLHLPASRAGQLLQPVVTMIGALERLRSVTPFGRELAFRVGDYALRAGVAAFGEQLAGETAARP